MEMKLGRRQWILMWMPIPAKIDSSTVSVVNVVVVRRTPSHIDAGCFGWANTIGEMERKRLGIKWIIKFTACERFLCFEYLTESSQCLPIGRAAKGV